MTFLFLLAQIFLGSDLVNVQECSQVQVEYYCVSGSIIVPDPDPDPDPDPGPEPSPDPLPQPLPDDIHGGALWLPEPDAVQHGVNLDFSDGMTGWQPIGRNGSASVVNGEMVLVDKTVRQSLGEKNPGSWKITGSLRTEDVADGGFRMCLEGTPHPWTGGRICTENVSGTGTHFIEVEGTLIDPSNMYLKLEAYSRPTGTAIFTEVTLEELVTVEPVAFMRYPNYRGVLEGDEIVLEVEGEATIALETVDGFRLSSTQTTGGTVSLDASAMGEGYHIVRTIGQSTEGPIHAVIRGTPPIDRFNRFYKDGQPFIPVGVYDSGLPYVQDEASWRDLLAERRRLWELNPDLYLNYHYGGAPPQAINSLMDALWGGWHIQTANCFAANEYQQDRFRAQKLNDPSFMPAVSGHPGFGGVYIMDECVQGSAVDVFESVKWFRQFPGFNWSVSNRPAELRAWRDVADVQGVDPYPIHATPDRGRVASWVSQARESVHDSRPVLAVLQFLQIFSTGRWPTRDELRDMSLTAIVEGADAIMFWSIGNGRGGLFWSTTCDPQAGSTVWCPERNEHFEDLRATFDVIRSIPAEPNLPADSGNPNIKVVLKGSRFVFYNASDEPQTGTVDGSLVVLGPHEAGVL